MLQGKKGLIIGIANSHSIAWGCAKVMHAQGAELAVTYLNDKAKPYVEPLAQEISAPIFMPLDVTQPEQMQALMERISKDWGKLDFLVHSIAYAPLEALHGRVTDCPADAFLKAMHISCHSFIQLAHMAEPLMNDGGSLMTMSYYGAEKVVTHYNIMGPVKAALESATRYMAVELGGKNIRVNAISPGPIATRAASGIANFNELLHAAEGKAAIKHLVEPEDVGNMAAFLASDQAHRITGGVHYVDSGYEIVD